MDPPQSNNSQDPDVSPKTATVPDLKTSSIEYFPAGQNAAEGPNTSGRTSEADRSSERRSSVSFASQTTKLNESIASSAEENTTQHSAAHNDERRGSQAEPLARKASTSSVKFRQPRNLSLPQGNQKQTDASRIRASSPPPNRPRA
ncbi:hypothetical protein S7711_10696 [Stachybotrys chartarum IBT 7711]|uniref:Uncharacterized protein n=1 Tax=Stachybotrys chartarum (strain CBS 109288 / IBT 7711) TaxID=1280523 RepID=A0A084AUR3_STACB|nr:hypothetical protein S7711_10696 [Stachybotrys chartarum IBT 7711]KFA52949.1 hypothetical protein S40293_10438 [Stachybotrys chartarum IBT 40293]